MSTLPPGGGAGAHPAAQHHGQDEGGDQDLLLEATAGA